MSGKIASKIRKALTAAIGIVIVAAFSHLSYADGNARAGRSIEGVWHVTTTPRFCDSGDAIPNATFEGLFTFHKDGTMSVWVQNAAIFITRSPSQGLWERDLGKRKYAYKFVHLRYDNMGYFSGKQDASGSLTLNKNGNEFATDSSTTFFDLNGDPEGMGCATAVGTRYDWDE